MSLFKFYNGFVKRRKDMLNRIICGLFYKTAKRNNITIISKKREISENFFASKKADGKIADNEFWENRGKFYGKLFAALNGRNV